MPLVPGAASNAHRKKPTATESAASPTIDLARIDPAIWRIRSGPETFGPFTTGQLQQFAVEGRLSLRSQVSTGEAQPFQPVGEIARLAYALSGAFAERARRRAEAANFLIVIRASAPAEAEMATSLPAALNALGKNTALMPGTWLLRSSRPLSAVRAGLTSALPASVQVVIMEAREARLGWLGFGGDLGDSIRDVWNAAMTANPAEDAD